MGHNLTGQNGILMNLTGMMKDVLSCIAASGAMLISGMMSNVMLRLQPILPTALVNSTVQVTRAQHFEFSILVGPFALRANFDEMVIGWIWLFQLEVC